MQRACCLLILILAAPAFATDGCLSTGYGIKRLGQGGTGVAFPQDSLAAATNPAGMVFAGDRLNLGMTFFRPLRAPQLGKHSTDYTRRALIKGQLTTTLRFKLPQIVEQIIRSVRIITAPAK